jgi:hypothetical protein
VRVVLDRRITERRREPVADARPTERRRADRRTNHEAAYQLLTTGYACARLNADA